MQFAIFIQWRPGRRRINVNVERIPDDFRVRQFTADLPFEKPLIALRDKIASPRRWHELSVCSGSAVVRPKVFAICLTNSYERQSIGNAVLQ
jgi:hypothetical protein